MPDLLRWLLRDAMSMGQIAQRITRQPATAEDVARILGYLDATKMLPIMALRPTIGDIEDASMWLDGDRDVFGPGESLKGNPSEIVTILTADEEAEPPRSG